MTRADTVPASPDDTLPPDPATATTPAAKPILLLSLSFAHHLPPEDLTPDALQGFAALFVESVKDGFKHAAGSRPCPVDLDSIEARVVSSDSLWPAEGR